MLKLLIRIAAFGIVLFLAALSALFLAADEDDFPQGTDHTARLDFVSSPLSKSEVISQLNALASESNLRLERVIAGPENFLTTRSVYVFGSAAPSVPEAMSWFRPGINGERRAATELGDVTMDGAYVFAGSHDARATFERWLVDSRVQATIGVKSTVVTLQYTLLTSGAWLPAATCLVLLVGLIVSWYVLRARGRVVRMLCGAPSWRIVIEDFVSLCRIAAPPVLAALVLSFGVLGVSGRAGFARDFGVVIVGLIGCVVVSMLCTALLISMLAWPSVNGIAMRRAPERHFRLISEALKVGTLVIIAVSLPAIGAGVTSALHLSEEGARWAALDDQVSVRIRAGSPHGSASSGPVDGRAGPGSRNPLDEMDPLISAAQQAGKLTFSYGESSQDRRLVTGDGANGFGVYDGYVILNPSYLKALAPLLGFTPDTDQPIGRLGERMSFDELPPALGNYFRDSYPLWNRAGRTLDGFSERFEFFRYAGARPFPGLHPARTMETLRNPVIVVVDDPSITFTPQFLGSTLSSGNAMFNDADWLRDTLATSPLGANVLSIDRVSDSGLYSSQQAHQTASVRAMSYSLVLVALIASIAASAWIHVLAHARRVFVQRTAGWTWCRILCGRLVWEAGLAATVVGIILLTNHARANDGMWWVLLALPLYVAVSIGMHLNAARRVFAARVARFE